MTDNPHQDAASEPVRLRPAWFPDDAARPYPSPEGTPLSLADFAHQRRRPEPPRYRRPVIERREFDELYAAYDEPRRAPRGTRRRRDMLWATGIMTVTALAVGIFGYDRSTGGKIAQSVAALWQAGIVAPPKGGGSSTIRKTVATASLEVSDAEGAPGALVPLSLKPEPAAAGQSVTLRVDGLPPDSYLTAGTRLDGAAWLLKPGEEQGVKIMVPKILEAPATLTVAAIEPSTGELASPVRELSLRPLTAGTMIVPAAAPPAKQAATAGKTNVLELLFTDRKKDIRIVSEPSTEAPSLEAQSLLASGDSLMDAGEIVSARGFYERALALGAGEAALKLGESYDPAIFASLKVRGLQPDRDKARAYYEQAKTGGVSGAVERLEALGGP